MPITGTHYLTSFWPPHHTSHQPCAAACCAGAGTDHDDFVVFTGLEDGGCIKCVPQLDDRGWIFNHTGIFLPHQIWHHLPQHTLHARRWTDDAGRPHASLMLVGHAAPVACIVTGLKSSGACHTASFPLRCGGAACAASVSTWHHTGPTACRLGSACRWRMWWQGLEQHRVSDHAGMGE